MPIGNLDGPGWTEAAGQTSPYQRGAENAPFRLARLAAALDEWKAAYGIGHKAVTVRSPQ